MTGDDRKKHRERRVACTLLFAGLLLAQEKERFKFKQVSHKSLLNYYTQYTVVNVAIEWAAEVSINILASVV